VSEAKAAKATSAGAVAVESVDGDATRPRYRRILLKLSGEALLGSRQYGVDPNFCAFIAAQVAEVHRLGVEIGIVVGGGNIFRGSPPRPREWTAPPATTSACWPP